MLSSEESTTDLIVNITKKMKEKLSIVNFTITDPIV
jgi:hypothetical protein